MQESLNKQVDLKALVPLMKEQLNAGKTVSFVPRGNSMRPMLGNGTDMIVLKKPEGRLHLNDVALYFRRETDAYVVHRVVNFSKDRSYVMLGDNNMQKEYNITDEDIVGVLTAFYHKGRMISVNHPLYRLYCDFWFYSRPLRFFWRRAKGKLSRMLKNNPDGGEV